MRFTLAALALLPASAFATITITGPSASSFWVQNTSNVITWTFTAGDPSPVDILVVNSDNTTLNGAFDIARFVDVSIQSVTVTNVTLNNGTNYAVQFVNPMNASQIYATSQTFSVMPNGTAPATTSNGTASTVVESGSLTASGSSTAPSGSSTAPTSASSSASSGSPSATSNAAPRSLSLGSGNVLSLIAAGGIAVLGAILL